MSLPVGTPCSSEGSRLPWGQLQALAAISSYSLELREGFKDKRGCFLCLSPWPEGCRGRFQLWLLFPIIFGCFLAPWGSPKLPGLVLARCSYSSTHLPATPWILAGPGLVAMQGHTTVVQGETCPPPPPKTGVTGGVG